MLCLALLEACTGQWQDLRDMLQTSAWRPHQGHASQNVLFPAIAHELQTACELYAQVWVLMCNSFFRQSAVLSSGQAPCWAAAVCSTLHFCREHPPL